MQFQLEQSAGAHAIRAYQRGAIKIGATTYTESLIVTPEKLLEGWCSAGFEQLQRDDFASIAELEPEVVVLGTGEKQRFPNQKLMIDLINAGIGVEVMDTAAACRTYNILLADSRRVAAALLLD